MKRSINEISALVSNKWRLIDSNHKVPISSSLYELIGYTLTPSLQLSEKADDKESEKQDRDDFKNNKEKDNNP
jgi:hypothetical protein